MQAIRRAEIENVLRMHAGVRDAVVFLDDLDDFSAFVIPDDAYLDDISGQGTAGRIVLGKWQKTFDLSQYQGSRDRSSHSTQSAGIAVTHGNQFPWRRYESWLKRQLEIFSNLRRRPYTKSDVEPACC